MKSRDLMELAGRNLREAVLRNSLTTLGVAVGVASLVALLSLGIGLQSLLSRQMESSGLFDTIFVSPRVAFRGFGAAAKRPQPADEGRPLDDAAKQRIEKLPDVIEVYAEVLVPAELRLGEMKRVARLGGLPPSAKRRAAFENIHGAFFSGPAADEVIFNMEYARDLLDKPDGDPNSLLGKVVEIRYAARQLLPGKEGANGAAAAAEGDTSPLAGFGMGFTVVPRTRTLRVVGIIEGQAGMGPGGFGGGGQAYIPLGLAQTLDALQARDVREVMRSAVAPSFPSLTVRVKDAKFVPATEDAIKAMGFGAFSLLDAARNLRIFFAVIDLFLGIFGSLALAVASLGIINTLVMAILERRREIGVLKALGASDGDVRRLFFTEAGAMGFVGGSLGVLLGWLIGRIIHAGTSYYLRRQGIPSVDIWSVPWWLVLGAIGFAVFVSLVAGLYPASRAAKLNPVEALRYE